MQPTYPRRRPTLRDVAERAGVSFKTVSRVINGEPGVSAELIGRVDAAVLELGYQPDDRARRLRRTTSETGAIGFVQVDVANPFFGSVLRGVEDVARQRGCVVLSGSTDGERDVEARLLNAFVERRVDGLIVVPSSGARSLLQSESARGTPIVFVDLEIEGCAVDIVRSDHRGGARAATQHLLDHGHRDIAFFGDDMHTFSAAERLSGFLEATAAAGLTVPAERIRTERLTADEWKAYTQEYLQTHGAPTAFFTAQNFVSIGVTRALHAAGVHHDIALIGFDDVDFGDVIEPGISVVPQQPRELGRIATEALIRRIDGDRSDPQRHVLPFEVIRRGSGEIPPTRSA